MHQMKRISYILIPLLIITLFSFKLFATNQLTDMELYYQSLTDNFGENVFGSCTNISTGMLLSYYDTYLNDDIIAEEHDVASINSESPGTLWENLSTYSNNLNLYKTKLLELQDVSLQAKLYSYSCDLGNNTLVLSNDERKSVLNRYFNEYFDYTYGVDYTFSECYYNQTNSDANVRLFVKNEIDNGYPVIVHYDHFIHLDNGFYSDYSHACVAYSYDTNHLYCNLGDVTHPDNEAYDINDSAFHIITYAFSIHFNLEHKHSDNYNSMYDSNCHISSCPCGYIEYKKHFFLPYGPSVHKCKYCGESNSVSNCCGVELDPTGSLTMGTMVSIYGGNCYSNDLVVGYTRIAYLTGNSPSQSRLDYDWHTTNSSVVEVTKYGTILAKYPGTATIYFVYKSDPTKFGSINVTVSSDNSSVIRYISLTTDIRPSGYNGTEVTENGGLPNGIVIHDGYSRAICFSTSNTYPSIDNFYWYSSNTDYLTIDDFGYAYANNVSSNINVTIICISKYNSNLRGTIILNLVP